MKQSTLLLLFLSLSLTVVSVLGLPSRGHSSDFDLEDLEDFQFESNLNEQTEDSFGLEEEEDECGTICESITGKCAPRRGQTHPTSWAFCTYRCKLHNSNCVKDQVLFNQLQEFEGNVLPITGDPRNYFTRYTWVMLHDLGCFESLFSSPRTVRFLEHIRGIYKPKEEVYFHNHEHAVTVAQALYYILKYYPVLTNEYNFGLKTKCNLIIAAISHDLGHDGRVNAYYQTSVTKQRGNFAISQAKMRDVFNSITDEKYRGVQEYYHTIQFLHTLSKFDIFQHPTDKSEGVRLIINSILETDMALHSHATTVAHAIADNKHIIDTKLHFDTAKRVDLLKLCAKALFQKTVVNDIESLLHLVSHQPPTYQELLGGLLVHFADISNPMRRFEFARKWSKRFTREINQETSEVRNMINSDTSLSEKTKSKRLNSLHFMLKASYSTVPQTVGVVSPPKGEIFFYLNMILPYATAIDRVLASNNRFSLKVQANVDDGWVQEAATNRNMDFNTWIMSDE